MLQKDYLESSYIYYYYEERNKAHALNLLQINSTEVITMTILIISIIVKMIMSKVIVKANNAEEV
jgi:hypothetical protein